MEGTVKFFNESKGFGFITNDETGKDIFVHVTGLNGEALNEGDKVEYVEEEGRKGRVAAQVRVIHDYLIYVKGFKKPFLLKGFSF